MLTELAEAKFLLVDDEHVNLILLERILNKAGYSNIHTTTDSQHALDLFDELKPDMVLTDLHMPRLDGIGVIEAIQGRLEENSFLPILMLTADLNPDAEQRALSSGAKDFLTKPFQPNQINLRVRNLLLTRKLHMELQVQNQILERRVKERTAELEETRLEILERLAIAAEYRDYVTGQHTLRVGQLSGQIALRMGLDEQQAELIERAAPLHDVGKIGVPDNILLKPDRLTKEEYSTMKEHVLIGSKILSGGQSKLMQLAEEIALSHHERWDGRGYPHNLSADAIPLSGQIVAVADVFDTLVNERPYKPAWSVEDALTEIIRNKGAHFAPKVVDAFLHILHQQDRLPPEFARFLNPVAA